MNVHTLGACVFIISLSAAVQAMPIPDWLKAILQAAGTTATYLKGLWEKTPEAKN